MIENHNLLNFILFKEGKQEKYQVFIYRDFSLVFFIVIPVQTGIYEVMNDAREIDSIPITILPITIGTITSIFKNNQSFWKLYRFLPVNAVLNKFYKQHNNNNLIQNHGKM